MPCSFTILARFTLQWGHGREAMDGVLAQEVRERADWLQWGHGREAMDGRSLGGAVAYALASMGPWP